MRILVLGGTAWIGRAVAAEAVAAGHEVVCAARGSGPVAEGASLVVCDLSEDDGLAPLAGTTWDAVVDVSRQPGHVRRAVRDLDAAHYVYVSSVNAHQDATGPGLGAAAPRRAPLAGEEMTSMEDYGPAKVACEDHVLRAYAGRCAVVRPGLIGGPGDWSDRTTYWPSRFAEPACLDGRVLVPDAPDLATQVVDGRDLATWLLACAGERVVGEYLAVGPVVPLAEHLAVAAGLGSGRPVPAPEDWLLAHDVRPWAGPRSLPVWVGPGEEDRWLGACDGSPAYAAGLVCRPLEETLADGAAWRRTRDEAWSSGLTPDEERALLAELG